MGHLMLRNMKKVLEALGNLTIAKDGVDGSRIQQYAEAWSFGEVNAQFQHLVCSSGDLNDRPCLVMHASGFIYLDIVHS